MENAASFSTLSDGGGQPLVGGIEWLMPDGVILRKFENEHESFII